MLTHDRDSTVIHDSIFVRVGADTVVRERWRTVWRERTRHDTVRIRTTDTIVRTETVEKPVPQSPRKGAQAGWIAALALAALMAAHVIVTKHRLNNR